MIGLVYYGDDPHKRVFRVVYPEKDDAELDQPATEGKRAVMRKDDGTPHSWTSFGVDPLRTVLMDKAASDVGRKRGSPTTPKTEPVVFQIGMGLIPDANADAVRAFIAAQPTWKNFIDVTVQTLPVPLVSPSWVVTVDAVPAGFSNPTRSRNFAGHTVRVWVV